MPYLKRETLCPEPLDCRILTAALNLFVEKGYHNVSIHEIQKQANVSIGSIYKHFGGKEGIAKGLYTHLLNEIDELIDDIMGEVASPAEQCEKIIQQLFEYTETHQTIIAFIFHAKHPEFLSNEQLLCNTTPFKKIHHIIEQGISIGEFRDIDVWVASACILGSTTRMIQLRLDGLIKNPLPEYSESVIETAWQGIKVKSVNL